MLNYCTTLNEINLSEHSLLNATEQMMTLEDKLARNNLCCFVETVLQPQVNDIYIFRYFMQ